MLSRGNTTLNYLFIKSIGRTAVRLFRYFHRSVVGRGIYQVCDDEIGHIASWNGDTER